MAALCLPSRGAADSSNSKGMRGHISASQPLGQGQPFPLSLARRRCDLQYHPVGIPQDSPKASASKERASSVIHLFNKYLLSVCCGLGAVPGSHCTETWEARGIYNEGSQNQRPETPGLAPALLAHCWVHLGMSLNLSGPWSSLSNKSRGQVG